MIEKIIFNLLAFTLFILMFFNFVKKNDTNYLYLLIVQFIGICMNFVELIMLLHFDIITKTFMYILAIIIPITIFIIEYKMKINFTEILNSTLADICEIFHQDKKREEYIRKIVAKYPNSIIGHKKMAIIYKKNDDKESELEEYEKILELDPNEKNLYLEIGRLYKECNRKNEAKEIFTGVLKNKPDCYEASMLLGDILYEENEYKEAIQIYAAALRYYPNDYNIYYNLGMAYTMINDFQKAKESYKCAAQINSMLYHAKYSLGQISLISGDLKEAEMYFEECINCDDTDANSYYYLAKIAIIDGKVNKAINYANVAIENDSNIYEKFQNDNIFITIRNKIKKPIERQIKKEDKFDDKEKTVSEHLYNMCKLVGKLNNSDIKMIENVMKTKEKDINKDTGRQY